MTLRIVGAGLPRTGTNSLQLALERLLGAPCYHMLELFQHLDHVPVWQRAVDGETVDWEALFDGYPAAVDWPASAFWPELTAAYPDAFVLLSTRSDHGTWWRSMEGTIMAARQRGMASAMPPDHPMAGWGRMMGALVPRFCAEPGDPAAMTAAYERHNAAVRAGVPAPRLIDWQPGDGWEPLCTSLGRPVPDVPFPHVNTTAEFNARLA